MARPLLPGIGAGCALALVGCATPPYDPHAAAASIARAIDRAAMIEAFAVCHGYGCSVRSVIGLANDELDIIGNTFAPAPRDAADERWRIALAIGRFEQAAGVRLGTTADRPRTPFSMGDARQLDCVDEAINTSTYLYLLRRLGLLHWHDVGEPARRQRSFGLGVHYTAVLLERGTGTAFAVDSWFHANGRPAEVVELVHWLDGWEPGAEVP